MSDLLPCKRCGRMPIQFVMRFNYEDKVSYGCVCKKTSTLEQDAAAKWNERQGKPSDNTVIKELAEALEHAEYALDRAICFKHPSSSQKKIEQEAQEAAKQALTKHADRIKEAQE